MNGMTEHEDELAADAGLRAHTLAAVFYDSRKLDRPILSARWESLEAAGQAPELSRRDTTMTLDVGAAPPAVVVHDIRAERLDKRGDVVDRVAHMGADAARHAVGAPRAKRHVVDRLDNGRDIGETGSECMGRAAGGEDHRRAPVEAVA